MRGGRILIHLAQSFGGVIFAKRPRGSLYFCTSRLAAGLPARIAAPGKTRRVFNTVALFYFFVLRTRWIPKEQGASAC